VADFVADFNLKLVRDNKGNAKALVQVASSCRAIAKTTATCPKVQHGVNLAGIVVGQRSAFARRADKTPQANPQRRVQTDDPTSP
jgi:hypothetical protein